MSKPKDPVIAVINYFEHAELALAQQTLAIASAIVKNRQPRATTTKKSTRKPAAATAEPAPLTN